MFSVPNLFKIQCPKCDAGGSCASQCSLAAALAAPGAFGTGASSGAPGQEKGRSQAYSFPYLEALLLGSEPSNSWILVFKQLSQLFIMYVRLDDLWQTCILQNIRS